MKPSGICQKWGVVCVSLLAVSLAAPERAREVRAQETKVDERGETPIKRLFNGTDLTGWKTYVDPTAKNAPARLWSVKNGAIVCEGSVRGYLATEREYENYVLRLEWRWGEKVTRPNRSSSVFVHVTGPDHIWPKGLDVTLGADAAGEFFLVRGYELQVDRRRRDPKVERHYFALVPHADGPIGQWNQTEVLCDRGTVRARLNGRLVNEGTAAKPSKGRIVLLSEGAEILFRKIELRSLSLSGDGR